MSTLRRFGLVVQILGVLALLFFPVLNFVCYVILEESFEMEVIALISIIIYGCLLLLYGILCISNFITAIKEKDWNYLSQVLMLIVLCFYSFVCLIVNVYWFNNVSKKSDYNTPLVKEDKNYPYLESVAEKYGMPIKKMRHYPKWGSYLTKTSDRELFIKDKIDTVHLPIYEENLSQDEEYYIVKLDNQTVYINKKDVEDKGLDFPDTPSEYGDYVLLYESYLYETESDIDAVYVDGIVDFMPEGDIKEDMKDYIVKRATDGREINLDFGSNNALIEEELNAFKQKYSLNDVYLALDCRDITGNIAYYPIPSAKACIFREEDENYLYFSPVELKYVVDYYAVRKDEWPDANLEVGRGYYIVTKSCSTQEGDYAVLSDIIDIVPVKDALKDYQTYISTSGER